MIDRPTSVLEQSNCSAANLRRAAAPRQLQLHCNVAPLQPIWINCQDSRSRCFPEISMAHSNNFLTKWRFQDKMAHTQFKPTFVIIMIFDTDRPIFLINSLQTRPTNQEHLTNKKLFCHLGWDPGCCLYVSFESYPELNCWSCIIGEVALLVKLYWWSCSDSKQLLWCDTVALGWGS